MINDVQKMRTVDFKKGRKKYRKKFYLKSPQSVSDKTDNVFTMEDKLSTQNYKILIFDGHYITGYILFTYLNNFRPIRLENFAQYDLPMLHLLKFYCSIYQAGCWDLTNFNLISLFKCCMEGYQKYLKYPVSSNIQTKIFP